MRVKKEKSRAVNMKWSKGGGEETREKETGFAQQYKQAPSNPEQELSEGNSKPNLTLPKSGMKLWSILAIRRVSCLFFPHFFAASWIVCLLCFPFFSAFFASAWVRKPRINFFSDRFFAFPLGFFLFSCVSSRISSRFLLFFHSFRAKRSCIST